MTAQYRDGIRASGSHEYAEYRPYQCLAVAIVGRAIKDWRKLCHNIPKNAKETQLAINRRNELWEFLRSEWCSTLCGVSQDKIIKWAAKKYHKSQLYVFLAKRLKGELPA